MEDEKVDYEEFKAQMTKEQREAYESFIDYMVKLYYEFGYLLDESKEEKAESVE